MPEYFLKQLQNNFEDPKNGQNTDVNVAKSSDILVNFRFTSSIYDLVALKKIILRES